jgi:hypothetical protein
MPHREPWEACDARRERALLMGVADPLRVRCAHHMRPYDDPYEPGLPPGVTCYPQPETGVSFTFGSGTLVASDVYRITTATNGTIPYVVSLDRGPLSPAYPGEGNRRARRTAAAERRREGGRRGAPRHVALLASNASHTSAK